MIVPGIEILSRFEAAYLGHVIFKIRLEPAAFDFFEVCSIDITLLEGFLFCSTNILSYYLHS